MSKHQNQQRLSPEKYIRTRARTLPVGDCYINSDWLEAGKAMITVTRVHINGNITFGMYLVDLFCLGVKDTMWDFNKSPVEFREFIEMQRNKYTDDVKIVRSDYVLVHNIIYGALEFAEESGFTPHKGFELSRFILEEDDNRIPLIEIEFGFKGKPLYISNPVNPREKNRVLSHLKMKAGQGNYYFITEEEADDFFRHEEDNTAPDGDSESDAVKY